MFSSQTGSCQYYNGATNLATPFVRSSCFEPAYLNAQSENAPCGCPSGDNGYGSQLNCVPAYGHRGACYFDRECGPGQVCQSGFCQQGSAFDNRNSIWRRENSRVVGYAPADFKAPNGQVCKTQPYVVVDETKKRKVVCPILTSQESQPQCNTCLNTVFDCERFKGRDPNKFQQCMQYQRMLHYNVVTPNGQLIPLAIEMEGEGMEVARVAMDKCAFVCGSCQVYDKTSSDYVWNRQSGCAKNGRPLF